MTSSLDSFLVAVVASVLMGGGVVFLVLAVFTPGATVLAALVGLGMLIWGGFTAWALFTGRFG